MTGNEGPREQGNAGPRDQAARGCMSRFSREFDAVVYHRDLIEGLDTIPAPRTGDVGNPSPGGWQSMSFRTVYEMDTGPPNLGRTCWTRRRTPTNPFYCEINHGNNMCVFQEMLDQ